VSKPDLSAILREVQGLANSIAGPLGKRLTKLEKSIERLALAVGENRAAVSADDDDWRRLRKHPERCPISGWSRSTLCRHAVAGSVRTRTVRGIRYYSGADVRRLISTSDAP
jgi:hypothetical protein